MAHPSDRALAFLILSLANSLYSPDELQWWASTPQPALQGDTPLQAIDRGNLAGIYALLQQSQQGN